MGNFKRARQLRKTDTWAERLMWRWLRDRRFSGYKFYRQFPVGDYYLDFFCKEARLCVEIDGFHHGFPNQQQHDAVRRAYLHSLGIEELRFWNSKLRREAQSIRDTIFFKLQERSERTLPDYTRPITADALAGERAKITSPRPSPSQEREKRSQSL